MRLELGLLEIIITEVTAIEFEMYAYHQVDMDSNEQGWLLTMTYSLTQQLIGQDFHQPTNLSLKIDHQFRVEDHINQIYYFPHDVNLAASLKAKSHSDGKTYLVSFEVSIGVKAVQWKRTGFLRQPGWV